MAQRSLEASLSFVAKLEAASQDPFPRNKLYGVGVVLVGHRCIVFGGYSSKGPGQRIYICGSVNKSWRSKIARHNGKMFGRIQTSIVVNDALFLYSYAYRPKEYTFHALDLLFTEAWVPAGSEPCVQLTFGTSGSYVKLETKRYSSVAKEKVAIYVCTALIRELCTLQRFVSWLQQQETTMPLPPQGKTCLFLEDFVVNIGYASRSSSFIFLQWR